MASGKAAFEALFDGRWEPCHVSHADTSNAELQYTILGNLSGGEEWWEVVPASRVRLVDETSSVTFPGTKRGRKKAIFSLPKKRRSSVIASGNAVGKKVIKKSPDPSCMLQHAIASGSPGLRRAQQRSSTPSSTESEDENDTDLEDDDQRKLATTSLGTSAVNNEQEPLAITIPRSGAVKDLQPVPNAVQNSTTEASGPSPADGENSPVKKLKKSQYICVMCQFDFSSLGRLMRHRDGDTGCPGRAEMERRRSKLSRSSSKSREKRTDVTSTPGHSPAVHSGRNAEVDPISNLSDGQNGVSFDKFEVSSAKFDTKTDQILTANKVVVTTGVSATSSSKKSTRTAVESRRFSRTRGSDLVEKPEGMSESRWFKVLENQLERKKRPAPSASATSSNKKIKMSLSTTDPVVSASKNAPAHIVVNASDAATENTSLAAVPPAAKKKRGRPKKNIAVAIPSPDATAASRASAAVLIPGVPSMTLEVNEETMPVAKREADESIHLVEEKAITTVAKKKRGRPKKIVPVATQSSGPIAASNTSQDILTPAVPSASTEGQSAAMLEENSAATVSVTRKKPGRPKKVVAADVQSSETVAKPSALAALSAPVEKTTTLLNEKATAKVAKKKRGRPKKNVVVDAVATLSSETAAEPSSPVVLSVPAETATTLSEEKSITMVSKKRRGRPKKNVVVVVAASVAAPSTETAAEPSDSAALSVPAETAMTLSKATAIVVETSHEKYVDSSAPPPPLAQNSDMVIETKLDVSPRSTPSITKGNRIITPDEGNGSSVDPYKPVSSADYDGDRDIISVVPQEVHLRDDGIQKSENNFDRQIELEKDAMKVGDQNMPARSDSPDYNDIEPIQRTSYVESDLEGHEENIDQRQVERASFIDDHGGSARTTRGRSESYDSGLSGMADLLDSDFLQDENFLDENGATTTSSLERSFDAIVEVTGRSGGLALSQLDIPTMKVLFNRWAIPPGMETATVVHGDLLRGDRLVRVSFHNVTHDHLDRIVEMIQSIPRPVRLYFVRSSYTHQSRGVGEDGRLQSPLGNPGGISRSRNTPN